MLETNKEFSKNAPMKSRERLQIEYDIINFSNKVIERLIIAVEKSMEKCTEYYKKCVDNPQQMPDIFSKKVAGVSSSEGAFEVPA